MKDQILNKKNWKEITLKRNMNERNIKFIRRMNERYKNRKRTNKK